MKYLDFLNLLQTKDTPLKDVGVIPSTHSGRRFLSKDLNSIPILDYVNTLTLTHAMNGAVLYYAMPKQGLNIQRVPKVPKTTSVTTKAKMDTVYTLYPIGAAHLGQTVQILDAHKYKY